MRLGIALVSVTLILAASVSAQQSPSAVIADPPSAAQSPPGLLGITIPSHGVEMDATLYFAAGLGPHPVVLLLHGLPGYEVNGDLAQSIRRVGWNVFTFNYRGTWGTDGVFSLSSAIEDTAEAVRFLRDPSNASKYHTDPSRLVVVGHSVGGFLAGYEAGHDPQIAAVAMIAAVNLGRMNADSTEREVRLKRWETQLHPVRGVTAAELFAEADRHAKDWDYLQWGDLFRGRAVLLLEADDQNRADMEGLATALQQKGATSLTRAALPTDHSFSDHRIALQTIVIQWLEKLGK